MKMHQLSSLRGVIWEMEEWYKRRLETDVEVPAANLIFTFNTRPVSLSPAIRSVNYGTLFSPGNPTGYLPRAHPLSYKWVILFRKPNAACSKCQIMVYTFSLNTIFTFYILLTVHLDVILVNDQLEALFLMYLFHGSTCFEQQVLIIRRSKLYQYTIWYNTLWWVTVWRAWRDPPECVIPDDVLIQFGPPDDENLLL
jgi:hypothetical protein